MPFYAHWMNRISRRVKSALPAFLVAMCLTPLTAQAQVQQGWPEVDAYLKLRTNMRVSFYASSTREDREGMSASLGPNLDYYLKSLLKLRRITAYSLDESKARMLRLRAGYRYLPSVSGPTENRWLAEATGNVPLVRGVLLSDRNRVDLRFIDGDFSWRYRNRISAERTLAIRNYHFSPYIRAEVYYDSRCGKWSRTAESIGAVFPLRNRYELEPYYEHQNDTSSPPNEQTNAIGFVFSMYFAVRN